MLCLQPTSIRTAAGLVLKSCLTLATPWTVACQAPHFMGFSRQEYWRGLPFPSPGDLPDPGTEARSPPWQADPVLTQPPGKPPKQDWSRCKRSEAIRGGGRPRGRDRSRQRGPRSPAPLHFPSPPRSSVQDTTAWSLSSKHGQQRAGETDGTEA